MLNSEQEQSLECRATIALRALDAENKKYAAAMLSAVAKAFPERPRLQLVFSKPD